MAPDVERSAKNSVKSKLLTMDVIELTLLLKSIGFRLDSIDYDEIRSWGKKFNENGNASFTGGSATATAAATAADADHQHYINVEISCSKSKIVSNLTLRFNDSETSAAADASANTSPSKSMVCSCPKRETRNDNNSFWEVQSSGTFSNQKRSINAFMHAEAGIDHDTSSNLLPVLSPKSIALTHVLTQVLLHSYKNNTKFGDTNGAKDVDVKSIMQTIEKSSVISTIISDNLKSGGGGGGGAVAIEELNLITPGSSMNVTPTEQEGLMNVTHPQESANDQVQTALNDTINTEAFASPKSDIFTSSPHANDTASGQTKERDANVIDCLSQARQSIDQALLSMKLNVTRSLIQDSMASPATASPLLSMTAQELPSDNNRSRIRSVAPQQLSRLPNGRNTTQMSANARPPAPTALNRRASLGSVGLGRTAVKNAASPAIGSRLSQTRQSSGSIDRSAVATAAATATSKLSLVRKAVTGIGSRTIGSIASTAKSSTLPTALKRPSTITRQQTVPTIASKSATPTARKTVSTSKLTSMLPSSKIAKK